VPDRLIRHRRGRGFIVASGACLAALAVAATPAAAQNGIDTPSRDPQSDGTTISSRVTVTGSSAGGKAQSIQSSDANWTAPPCWYEPYYSPEQFEKYVNDSYAAAGKRNAATVYNYFNGVQSEMNKIKYHKGDDGKWWMLVLNDHMPKGQYTPCTAIQPWQWVRPGTPPVGPVITAEMLSQIAYGATKLPSREVTLSPNPNNQKVNLATYAKFDNPVDRVWVTAQLAGQGIAATVVAVPDSLLIEAGTKNAEPGSCEYKFAQSKNAYQVDTSKAGCNITYRRESGSGSYPLRARITWKVYWTASASPDGARVADLPTGYSTSEQNVVVREMQAVNR
jgi:hypothetical protein